MNCLFDIIVVLSPNMGGKSTYMRQISSLVVLAQIVGTLITSNQGLQKLRVLWFRLQKCGSPL